jgi:nucleoside-diphosphate-sugar epimerase
MGFSYTAQALSALLHPQGWQITATCRDAEKAAELQKQGIAPLLLAADPPPLTLDQLAGATHVLLSVPPTPNIPDPSLDLLAPALSHLAPDWVGYLSTTGVYGDHQGAWIDEDTPPGPVGERGKRRQAAEAAWAATGLNMHYFRLAGIYGPGRNGLRSLAAGNARRIDKPGQVFSRIHVADIANVLAASMARPNPGRAYSVCDDEPAPPQEVVSFAAALMAVAPPPLQPFDTAELSDMARSFYSENKRIKNDRIKTELGVALKYPTYRAGLTALWDSKTY